MMRPLNILITAAGSPSAPGLIRSLKNNGEREVFVVGTDMKTDPTILQMTDKCRLVPASDAPEYVDVLLSICREEKIDVLIPGVSAELLPLSLRKAEFEAAGTKVSVSNPFSIEICAGLPVHSASKPFRVAEAVASGLSTRRNPALTFCSEKSRIPSISR